MKILVSTICFIDFNHHMGEIYARYANRLIEDIMKYTSWDIRVATNAPHLFDDAVQKNNGRVHLLVDMLTDNKIKFTTFNQLLKYFAFDQISDMYDWVMYLDCDTGLRHELKDSDIQLYLTELVSAGIDGLGVRTDLLLHQSLENHESTIKQYQEKVLAGEVNPHVQLDMFNHKFTFYNVTSDNIDPLWLNAILPSEHFLFLRNCRDGRLQLVSECIKKFNDKLIDQEGPYYITSDMEAFEIGISLVQAGYFIHDGMTAHTSVFCIEFNGSNHEKIKI